MQRGDYIICEMHPKTGGYFTHLERTFCLGEPDEHRRRIYDGCLAAYQCGLTHFGPGKRITESMEAVKQTIQAHRLAPCEAGIHGHGLASLEYPRYRLHGLAADEGAIRAIGDEFRPGMVFAFNIDLVDPSWYGGNTGCCLAETVVITDRGARALHTHPLDLRAQRFL
jgi:Xaa-Pro dipeptidase